MAVSVKGDGAEEASAVERAALRAEAPGGQGSYPLTVTWGQVFQVAPGFDTAIERRLARFYDRYYDVELSSFGVPGYIAARPDRFATVPCLH